MKESFDSIEEYKELERKNKFFARFIKRSSVENYPEFINVLYEDILNIFQILERDRASFYEFSKEDYITDNIKRQLEGFGYCAYHDVMDGGHVDLLVIQDNYRWKAEAKISHNIPYVLEAIEQIDTYTSIRDTNAGIFIYNKNIRFIDFLNNFITEAEKSKYDLVFDELCKKTLTFNSVFTHKSGTILDIKFFGVDLNHVLRTSKKKQGSIRMTVSYSFFINFKHMFLIMEKEVGFVPEKLKNLKLYLVLGEKLLNFHANGAC